MIRFFKRRLVKVFAMYVLINLLGQLLAPSVVYALTDGPASPDFSDFEPVISTDMVNTFSGDFSYNLPVINVPGPSGSGYAMSLSYHQGMNPEEEASWVGFGWTLNPGIINRTKRGVADDFNGVETKTYNKVPPSWTESVNTSLSVGGAVLPLGANLDLQGRTYNNYGGFTKFWGAGISYSGVGLGVQFSNGEPTFSASVNPMAVLESALSGSKKDEANDDTQGDKNTSTEKSKLEKFAGNASQVVGQVSIFGSSYGMFARGQFNQAVSVTPNYGFTFRYKNETKFAAQDLSGFHLIGVPFLSPKSAFTATTGYHGTVSGNGNVPVKKLYSDGLMYAGGDFEEGHMGDYLVEKEAVYNRRIKYLGIPFSNPDNFAVTGEKLTGGFRLHKDRVGHFYSNGATSIGKVYNGGPLIESFVAPTVPPKAGINYGTTFLSGKNVTKVENWDQHHKFDGALFPDQVIYDDDNSGIEDENFFRFSGDMGGKIQYSKYLGEFDDNGKYLNGGGEIVRGTSTGAGNYIPGARKFDVDLSPMDLYDNGTTKGIANNGYDIGRSSYIDYGRDVSGKIEHFDITNEEGTIFRYDIPVLSRNESNTQIKVDSRGDGYITQGTYYMDDEYLEPIVDPQTPQSTYYFEAEKDAGTDIYTNAIKSGQKIHNEHIVGEYTHEPYATGYLMTNIFTADYVDVNSNGVGDINDYGGWTNFHYRKKYGELDVNGNTVNDWYRWRMPYYGLLYHENSISDEKDDLGSVSTGEKEVYYTGAIETKTHVAFFVTNSSVPSDFADALGAGGISTGVANEMTQYLTGSGTVRKDGWSAKEPNAGEDEVANSPKNGDNRGNDDLEYLERIVLFSKSSSTPIKTVHLEYDYSLCTGLPNSAGQGAESGKLTLKRMWSEYNGTSNTRISPYVFKYNYPDQSHYGQEVINQYSHITSYGSAYAGHENPSYSPYTMDPWGYNNYNGQDRFENQQRWKWQGEYDMQNHPFDPAAWQLKQVILPSGGEIHIQYEEKDYTHVQDKRAMGMVSLDPVGTQDLYEPTNGGIADKILTLLRNLTCDLDPQDIYISPADIQNVKDAIANTFDNIAPNHAAQINDELDNIAPDGSNIVEVVNNIKQLLPGEKNIYYLNLADLGYIDDGTNNLDGEIAKQAELIENELIGERDDCGRLIGDPKYIYFKFLYALAGANPSLEDCKSEYITGFVKVQSVGIDSRQGLDRIFLRLGEDQSEDFWSFLHDNEEVKAVPKQACFDFLVAKRAGIVDNNGCNPTVAEDAFDQIVQEYYQEQAVYDNEKGNEDDDKGLAPFGKRDREYSVPNDKTSGNNYWKGRRGEMRGALESLRYYDYDRPLLRLLKKNDGNYCININHELSYLRVPMLKAKRGGGIRVKRVLFYDEGIESGDEALYGTEYEYVTRDGQSSGVATNEPGSIREENALVTLVARYEQSLFSKLVAGRYKQEFEGPIGESIIPGPSVGYSRVIARNIYRSEHNRNTEHDDWYADNKSLGGFSVSEYHTAKDYPISQEFTYPDLGESNELSGMKAIGVTDLKNNRKRDWLPLPLGIININIKKEWASQGYNFILHDRHGKPKSTITYAGVFERDKPMDYPEIAKTEYEYYKPGEKVKLLRKDGKYVEDIPGKEMDIAMEMRRVDQQMNDFTLPFTIGLSMVMCTPPYPMINLGLGFTYSYNQTQFNRHITSKVTRYPAIVKSITTKTEGVENTVENIAFDLETGKPMLTRTFDEYHGELLAKANQGTGINDGSVEHDGSYYSMSIPSHWVYPYFGQIAKGGTTNELTLNSGNVVTYGSYGDPMNFLTEASGEDAYYETPGALDLSGYNGNAGVVSANIQTFSQFDLPGSSDADNKYRPHKNFIYKTDRVESDLIASTDNKIYNGGVYDDFTMFDFNASDATNENNGWLKANEVTEYSVHGEALEERNALGIYSAAKFNEDSRLPSMIAGNARNNSILFRSFEEGTENGGHSGKSSLYVSGASANLKGASNTLKVTQQLINNGGILLFWAKNPSSILEGNLSIGGNQINKVAQTGEWELFKVQLDYSGNSVGDNINLTVNCPQETSFDDVRFQPFDSEANCYVYDELFRLVVSFDDQHFGMYYEYNQEGKLIRKRIETERGFMTIQETQYNTPQVK